MDNSGVGFTDAGVLALLADTNRAGRGGYWGGEGGYGGPYATPSSLQHTLRCLSRETAQQTDALRDQFNNQNLVAAVGALGNASNAAEQRIADKLSAHEINELRESADLARQIAACCCDTQKGFLEQALRFQECCCETQKLVQAENQRTRELIQDNALRAAESQNNINQTVAAVIAAMNGGGHHGGH